MNDTIDTETRLQILLLRTRAEKRAAQRQVLALEEALDAQEDRALAQRLSIGPQDRVSDDLSHIVRAPRPAPEPAPPGEHTPDTVAP